MTATGTDLGVLRTHLSLREIESISPTRQNNTTSFMKPTGFWYEVDGDWRRWCEENSFLDDREYVLYRLVLGKSVNLLRLATPGDIDAFHREYAIPYLVRLKRTDSNFGESSPEPLLHWARTTMSPDWSRVAEKYDGIEIAPYQWSRRLVGDASFWYYPWDCASGCLWTPRDSSLEPIGTYTPVP